MNFRELVRAFSISLLFSITASGITIVSTLDTNAPSAEPAYRPETGLQTGRFDRNGVKSNCGSLKATPGLASATGDRRYDEFEFVALGTGCITVTLTDSSGSLFSVAYNDSGINPSSISSNYLADSGSSSSPGTSSRSYSFDVVEGQVFNIVVHENIPGGGVGQSYTLEVSGVKLAPDFSISETLDTDPIQQSYAYQGLTGNQTGRITRNGIASTCTSPTSNPGIFTNTGIRRRDLYRITPFTSGCATVTLAHTGNDSAHVVVYDQNGFNPNAPSDNYLADSGNSASNRIRYFSFLVQAGVPFDLVVHEVNPGAGAGDTYTLNISGVLLAPTIEIDGRLDSISPVNTVDFDGGGGDQTGRLTRNSVASTCDAPKSNPGIFAASGSRRFDTYTVTPTASGCVEIALESPGAGSLFAVTYDGSGFVPATPDANYLADPGSSPTLQNPEVRYSFLATAGAPFTVVVHEKDTGNGIGENYKLKIRGAALNAAKRAAPFDFDGDRRTDVSIFRPGPGQWWYLRSSDNGSRAYEFGTSNDKIIPADFTGDGVTDIAFFRPSTGEWFVLRSEDSTFFSFPFGTNSDLAAPGDFDNDGQTDPAVYRASAGTWFILRSSDGGASVVPFGIPEDKPVIGDYDGDGADDIAVFRPSVSQWWINRSSEGVIAFEFGAFGDMPIPADYTGDGRTDVAFFRPSNEWYVLRSEDNSYYSFPFGAGGDIPVPGDFDGDGIADAAVFRPSSNTWFNLPSSGGFGAVGFGAPGDIPVPTAYQP